MKVGLVGYQGSGKSSLFEWLTGTPADPSLAHASQHAMATVRDPRVADLCEIYRPKKITEAALEIFDTAGLARSHQGNAARLSQIREADCLVHVIGVFGGAVPKVDMQSFMEDLLLADLEIVTGRVERLREALRKPRPDREEQQVELQALEPLLARLEEGQPIDPSSLTDDQQKVTRSFRLLTQKRRMVLINLPDDGQASEYESLATADVPVVCLPVGLELELSRMAPDEREAFREEMGVASFDRDGLIRALMSLSGQMLFFTAGEKEVRTWMVRQQATAVEAAGSIHTDLARGFIRAEVMRCEDLVRLGSERDLKAAGLNRQEPKDYVLQDGDILNIRFSV
ncbi:MAG: DUF933 domain-containing protein [Pirellulales bacterium]